MDDSTLRAHLRRFGLSKKEVDTYLTLLEYGEATASTIANVAGVSKRYVYSVSETLEDRGFVTVADHAVPTTIRALPPKKVGQGLVLGIVGGAIGVGLTLPAAEVLNRVGEALVGFEGLVQVPDAVLLIGFAIATVVGTLSASVVAWQISRLDTLEALG
jgi:predicted DNA-binding transcriptional regulator